MQPSIGTYIRQLRRARNLTQTELGGAAFSKSYVSAVEAGKLPPSPAALKHFAALLGEPEETLFGLNGDGALVESDSFSPSPTLALSQGEMLAREKVAWLESLFEQTDYADFQAPRTFFSLSKEALAQLSLSEQAHYTFFYGIFLQKETDYFAAIHAFEQALARESHPQHLIAILYELGACYLSVHSPHIALTYALRAHRSLTEDTSSSFLAFRIELICGRIYLDLERYAESQKHFEQARLYLNARQNMAQAGLLYWGLGYCASAQAFEQAFSGQDPVDATERLYQQSFSYFLQSCTLAQMAVDGAVESKRRLSLSLAQLDWCTWHGQRLRRQQLMQRSPDHLLRARLISTLDEVSQQCRQLLLLWSKTEDHQALPITALTLLVRCSLQRAFLYYESTYENSTFQRECFLAVSLCQQILDASLEDARLETLIWSIGNLPDPAPYMQTLSLPRLPDFPELAGDEHGSLMALRQAEMLWMAAEVAIILGQTSRHTPFVQDCFTFADSCFIQSLMLSGRSTSYQDAGSLTRGYQRYISLLEQRLLDLSTSDAQQDYQLARSLLALTRQQLVSCRSVFSSTD